MLHWFTASLPRRFTAYAREIAEADGGKQHFVDGRGGVIHRDDPVTGWADGGTQWTLASRLFNPLIHIVSIRHSAALHSPCTTNGLRTRTVSVSKQYDAIIIGSGIIGGAIGLELAKRGSRTLNVDRHPAAGYGSTSNTCAIIRFHYSTAEGVAMARESYYYWLDGPKSCGCAR